jgi:hypothetical protein
MATNSSISAFSFTGADKASTTVNLQWTTASNAAVAQTVMNGLESLVGSGAETVVGYPTAPGSNTLPPLPTPTITGIVVALGAGSAEHLPVLLNGNYDAGISNDTSASPAAQSWIVGAGTNSDTVMVGSGGGQVVNFGTNTQVFMTGQAPQVFQEIGLANATPPSADLWVDGSTSVNGSTGSTTINLDVKEGVVSVLPAGVVTFGGFQADLNVINNGNGQNVVDIGASTVVPFGAGTVAATIGGVALTVTTVNAAEQNVVFVGGSSTVATTINGAGVTGPTVNPSAFQPPLWVIAYGSATVPTAVVNSGASPVYAFSTGGIVSVNGGSARGDINEEAPGYFKSGSGGNAILASSPTQATTLVGGGPNDNLWAIGNKTTLMAGAGNQTLASFASTPSVPAGGPILEGNLGAGASTTSMLVESDSGDHFISGNGTTLINIAPFSASIGDNTYKEGVSSASNVATISGFNVGTDTISLDNPAGGDYVLHGTGATGLNFTVAGGNTTVAFGDGTTWTIFNATLTDSNFHHT